MPRLVQVLSNDDGLGFSYIVFKYSSKKVGHYIRILWRALTRLHRTTEGRIYQVGSKILYHDL